MASADASYPQVWNNALVDPSFGVTSRVFLDQLTPAGRLLSTLPVPDGAPRGSRPAGDGHLLGRLGDLHLGRRADHRGPAEVGT